MAETLSVQDMLPNKFEPKRKNRWIFALEGIDSFLIKTAARPSISIEEQTISYMNSKRLLIKHTATEQKSARGRTTIKIPHVVRHPNVPARNPRPIYNDAHTNSRVFGDPPSST